MGERGDPSGLRVGHGARHDLRGAIDHLAGRGRHVDPLDQQLLEPVVDQVRADGYAGGEPLPVPDRSPLLVCHMFHGEKSPWLDPVVTSTPPAWAPSASWAARSGS